MSQFIYLFLVEREKKKSTKGARFILQLKQVNLILLKNWKEKKKLPPYAFANLTSKMTFEMHLESIHLSSDAFHPFPPPLDLGIYIEITTHELGDF